MTILTAYAELGSYRAAAGLCAATAVPPSSPPSSARSPFRRFSATDMRSIVAAGPVAPRLAQVGEDLAVELPAVLVRSLAAYALERVG